MAGGSGASFLVTNAHLIRPFACELCERVYTRQEHLDRHVSAKHTGEKDHLCLTCGKRFSRRDILRRHEQAHVKAKNLEAANLANGTVPVKRNTKAAAKKPAKRRASPKASSLPPLNKTARTSKACDRCSRSKLRCDADGDDTTNTEVACARCLRAGFQCLYTRAAHVRKQRNPSRSGSSANLTRDNSGDSEEEHVEGNSEDDYYEPGALGREEDDEEDEENSGPANIYRQNMNQNPVDRRPPAYMNQHPYYNAADPTWQRPPDNFYSNTNGFSNIPRQPPLVNGQTMLPHQQAAMLPHQYYPVPFPSNFQYPPFPPANSFGGSNNPYTANHHPYTDASDAQDVASIAQSLSGLAQETAMKSNIDWSVLQRNPFTPDLNLTLSPAEGESALPPTDSTALDHRRDSVGSSVNGTRSNVYMNSAAESLLSLARF